MFLPRIRRGEIRPLSFLDCGFLGQAVVFRICRDSGTLGVTGRLWKGAIMEFTAGLLLGAILGVVADRLLTYLVEKRVYLKIQPSFHEHITEGQALSVNITNEGFEPLPPYRIALYNPHRGTLYFFDHEQKTDRLPGQTDVFMLRLTFLMQHREEFLSWFTQSRSLAVSQNPNEMHFHDMTSGESQQWFLRLVVEGSDSKILYQSNKVGVALVEILRGTLQTGALRASGEQAFRAHVTTSPLARLRDWWSFRKDMRRLRSRKEGKCE